MVMWWCSGAVCMVAVAPVVASIVSQSFELMMSMSTTNQRDTCAHQQEPQQDEPKLWVGGGRRQADHGWGHLGSSHVIPVLSKMA